MISPLSCAVLSRQSALAQIVRSHRARSGVSEHLSETTEQVNPFVGQRGLLAAEDVMSSPGCCCGLRLRAVYYLNELADSAAGDRGRWVAGSGLRTGTGPGPPRHPVPCNNLASAAGRCECERPESWPARRVMLPVNGQVSPLQSGVACVRAGGTASVGRSVASIASRRHLTLTTPRQAGREARSRHMIAAGGWSRPAA